MGGVFVSPNIKKESVRISPNGDFIDPKTKQVIQEVEPEFVAPIEQPTPQIQTPPKDKSIKELIAETEAALVQLKEMRKQEIERMKAELAELEEE
jgi:hypothetical protein